MYLLLYCMYVLLPMGSSLLTLDKVEYSDESQWIKCELKNDCVTPC